MKLIRICLHVWESTDFHMGACGKSSASCWKNKGIRARFHPKELNWIFWLWNVILQNIFRCETCSYQRSTVIKIYWLAMKICNMYVWVILSKPGSNNLYLKVPPSIGIGQQCINAFGYHGNGVATTYFRLATIHCIILCSCVYYCLTHPQPQNSCLCICRLAWPHFLRTKLHSAPNGDFYPRIWAS